MEIKVAGAGAGKTTNLAHEIAVYHKTADPYKNIYCVAFTNNAVARIEEKLKSLYGDLPPNIKVSTIHSFLFQEIVRPFFYLLYGKHYQKISLMNLPAEPAYRANKIRDLASQGILHVSDVPQNAKWVVSKKSSDKRREKDLRKIVCTTFCSYCSKVYIDEAQDIDADMLEVFTALNALGIEVAMVGDPKQDLRGYGCFRTLIGKPGNSVQYINECYRCPQTHLKVSNTIVTNSEKQSSDITEGRVEVLFENDVVIADIVNGHYDLMYIYRKNGRVETHKAETNGTHFEQLQFEISKKLNSVLADEREVELAAYNYTEGMLSLINQGISKGSVMKRLAQHTGQLTNQEYGAIISLLNPITQNQSLLPVVSSLEAIKGLEGNDCLFILTSDLAAYLFKEKTEENKTKNALYVGLTRSLRNLSILITTEVEEKYTRKAILEFFGAVRDS